MLVSLGLGLTSVLWPVASADCGSTAQCNRLGTEALQAGDHERAVRLFERQVDFAETALREADADADHAAFQHGREIAVNNAALAWLRADNCLRARAWLEAAGAEHKATQANRRQLDQRCQGRLSAGEHTGEFWQYAGHGAWNTISIRPTGDDVLRLDAFWMRVGRGPLHEWGPAAFGEMEQVFLHIEGDEGNGLYEALDPDTECRVRVRYTAQGLEIRHSDHPDCQVGGAGADLFGRYWRVGEEAPLPDED